MLSLYTGTVGSGKSFHALELGLNFIKKNGYVIANFPIKPPKKYITKRHKRKWEEKILKRWLYYEEISVEYLMALSLENGWFGKEAQCLVLIDEAGIMFNSRDWQSEKGTRNAWIKFLSQSRKFGFDFVFVCQADRMIDKQIRGLVEYEVKHRKLNNSKLFGFLSLFKFTGFMYIYKWYGTRVKANLQMSYYKAWVGNRYDTMKIFNLEDLVESMKKIYQGKVVPSAVASQISIWEEQILAKIEQEKLLDQDETFSLTKQADSSTYNANKEDLDEVTEG